MEVAYSFLAVIGVILLVMIIESYRKGSENNLLSEQSTDLANYYKNHLIPTSYHEKELNYRKQADQKSYEFHPPKSL